MESTVLGDFRLIKRIAKGGMGEVYQAYDTRCRRYVALKKIREDLENYQGIRKRFLSEAHIAASLTHPSTISIFTIQSEHDPLYYTMPLLEGQSLKALILQARKDPHLLPMSKVVSIFLDISRGIAHAHSRGFLHRDIKAENIWIGPCDETVILDWGVAKSVSDVQEELGELWSDLSTLEEGSEDPATDERALSESVLEQSSFDESLLPGGSSSAPSLDRSDQASSSSRDKRRSQSATLEALEGIQRTRLQQNLTRPGKVVGTLSYMAPERALKKQVSYASDIYSLGVLLYFMLTLHLPFRRRSLKDYLRVANRESYIDPRVRAPFRDIPKGLVQVVERCLAFEAEERYLTVQALIDELQLFTQAGSDWVQHAELSPQCDRDWLGKEWIYLTTSVAQSEGLHPEPMGWVTRMISKASFEGNLKLRMEIKPKEDVSGLGLLLSAPGQESSHRSLDGYCLWIGAEGSTGGQLLRNGVMVLDLPGFCLTPGVSHQLTVECLHNVLHCYFDHVPKVTYVSYLPLLGTHVGLVVAKGHFDFVRVHVFGGKHSLKVSCLAVPDAFLAQKMYRQALAEYHRIGQSFFDYLEGRQAIFRAGITLIEWARQKPDRTGALELLEQASDEFEKLKGTLSAPLEWLGKSLVYREMGDGLEEMNALELACRRFETHPLVGWIHEEVVFRLHEHARGSLTLSCRIVLLIVRALPHFMQRRDIYSRVKQIHSQLPVIGFWQCDEGRDSYVGQGAPVEGVVIRMGYFLRDERTIVDICTRVLERSSLVPSVQARLVQNAIYALLFMGQLESAAEVFQLTHRHEELPIDGELMQAAIEGHWSGLEQRHFAFSYGEQRLLRWLVELQIQALIRSLPAELQMLLSLADLLLSGDSKTDPNLLAELGWALLAAQYRLRLLPTSDCVEQQRAVFARWLDRWWEVASTYAKWPEGTFLQACLLLFRGSHREGFELLAELRHCDTQHPLAVLEAWVHRRLVNLQPWRGSSLLCEQQRLLRYGWLLLHMYHCAETAAHLYQRLEEGSAYAIADHL